jgi:hypothetical protein
MNVMTIQINVSNREKMLHLVELLKTMSFVESLKVEEEEVEKPNPKPLSFFEKYNGCLPNLDVQAFENYLTETRNEWERPRS